MSKKLPPSIVKGNIYFLISLHRQSIFCVPVQCLTARSRLLYGFNMRRLVILAVVLILGADIWICHAAQRKAKPVVNQGQKDESFQQLFSTLFTQWDRNNDGKLDLKEINAAVEDPSVRETDAAVAVVLRRHVRLDDETETDGLTLQQALSLAGDPQIQKAVSGDAAHIHAINHSLFLPDDPNLFGFHQGGMGDCYLLAVIGAFVYHNPQAVRTMIKPELDGKFEVQFGNGKNVVVEPITDAELILGATEGRNHGIWLSVLEKAYAQLHKETKEERTGQEIEDDEAVFNDLIGHGGYYSPVIVLLTGHKTAGAPMERWLNHDPKSAVEKMDELLTKLSSEHRLMAVGTAGNKAKALPKGTPHGHVLAVLEYDPTNRMVHMFNPWGNNFRPAGSPGLVNGYPTQHGMFDVPIDEFMQIFSGFSYETDKTVVR